MAIRLNPDGLPPLPEPLRSGDEGYHAPDVPPPEATPKTAPVSASDFAKCDALRTQIQNLAKQRQSTIATSTIGMGAALVMSIAKGVVENHLAPEMPPHTADPKEIKTFVNDHIKEIAFIKLSPLLNIAGLSIGAVYFIKHQQLKTPLYQAINAFETAQCREILGRHAEARKAMGLPAQHKTQITAIDLPQEVQSVVSTHIETEDEIAAYTAEGHHGLWSRGIDFLEALPATIEGEIPASIRYFLSTELYMAGMSIGIVRSAAKTIYGIPELITHISEGQLSFSDVGTGLWMMVKTDAGKLWDAPENIVSGNPLTAGSNVGDVAFDVFTTVEVGASALKAGRLLTQSAKLTIKTAVQTTTAASESLGQMIQQMGETLAFGGMTPAYATAALADEASLISTIAATLPKLPRPQEALSCAMASAHTTFSETTKPFNYPTTQKDFEQFDIPTHTAAIAEDYFPATPVTFGVVASDLHGFLSGLPGLNRLRQTSIVDAMKAAGIPKEIPRHFSYLGDRGLAEARIVGRSAKIPGTNGLNVGLTQQKVFVKGRPTTVNHVAVWKSITSPGVRGK